MERLYIVTRADMPLGVQLAQTVHAASTAPCGYWYQLSNTIVCLSVPTAVDLAVLLSEARYRGIRCWPFFEDDRGGELTAIAFEPYAAKMLRGLPLALRDDRAAR